MARYLLVEKYNTFNADEYSFEDLERYLSTLKEFQYVRNMDRNLRVASDKCKRLFSSHGYCIDRLQDTIATLKVDELPRFKIPQEDSQTEFVYPEKKINMRFLDKKQLFSYLQVLAYTYRKAISRAPKKERKRMHIPNIWEYLEHPSTVYNDIYKEILNDLEVQTSKKYSTKSQCKNLQIVLDIINTIMYSLSRDYGIGNENSDLLLKNMEIFRIRSSAAKEWALVDSEYDDAELYLDAFHRIVSFAKCCAWESDLLTALRTVRESVLLANSLKEESMPEEFIRMISPSHKQIEVDDQQSLVYSEGKIIEVDSSYAPLIENTATMDATVFLDALADYIRERVAYFARKVFCTEFPTRGQKDRIKTHICHVRGYWTLELKRYGRHGWISKAKLISIFQASFLMEKKAHYTLKKLGAPISSAGYAEAQSLSSTLLNPEEKNIYYYHLICVWIDYQTLFNTASAEYARYYLELSISALEAVLADGGKLPMSAVQKRAEHILRCAIRYLIPQDDNSEELSQLLDRLQSHGNKWQYTAGFCMEAQLNHLGAYCRVYSAIDIAEEIEREIETWNREGQLNVNIDKVVGISNELSPFCIQISYNRSEDYFVLEGFSGNFLIS